MFDFSIGVGRRGNVLMVGKERRKMRERRASCRQSFFGRNIVQWCGRFVRYFMLLGVIGAVAVVL